MAKKKPAPAAKPRNGAEKKAREPKQKRTREGLKKADDGLPVDLAGGMIAQGDVVAFPYLAEDGNLRLRLGYVQKLGKSFADVVSVETLDSFRCTDPRNELIKVDPELLDSKVPIYEKVKFEAATNRKY